MKLTQFYQHKFTSVASCSLSFSSSWDRSDTEPAYSQRVISCICVFVCYLEGMNVKLNVKWSLQFLTKAWQLPAGSLQCICRLQCGHPGPLSCLTAVPEHIGSDWQALWQTTWALARFLCRAGCCSDSHSITQVSTHHVIIQAAVFTELLHLHQE